MAETKVNTFFQRIKRVAIVCSAVIAMQSCDSLIYDDPSTHPREDKLGTMQNIDATSYTKWIYINLETATTTSLDYDDTLGIPSAWDIALHRYDVKTNHGRAYETDYLVLDKLVEDIQEGITALPDHDQYTEDIADSIIIDMSTMMDGYLVRAAGHRNKVLCRWLDVNLSTMPPIYTPSNRVYLVEVNSRTVALRFTAYSDPQRHNEKGWISFEYKYLN